MCMLNSDNREKVEYHIKPDITKPPPQENMLAIKKKIINFEVCINNSSYLTVNPPKSIGCKKK